MLHENVAETGPFKKQAGATATSDGQFFRLKSLGGLHVISRQIFQKMWNQFLCCMKMLLKLALIHFKNKQAQKQELTGEQVGSLS